MRTHWGARSRRYATASGSDAPDAETSSEKAACDRVGNHIYFYGFVHMESCLALIKHARELDAELRQERYERGVTSADYVPIWLHINSPGGDLPAAFAASDHLRSLQTPVYSIIEGEGASAATLLSVVCARRYILPNALMMIHQLWGAFWGKHEEFEDTLQHQNMEMDRIVAIYSEHTRIEAARLRELLKRDTWFGAEECVELGLADEVKVRAP